VCSPSQIALGAAASGIFFLMTGCDTSASDASLLATILDPRWGVFLPVVWAFLIARCFSQGGLKGYVFGHISRDSVDPQRLFSIPSYSLAYATLCHEKCCGGNIREDGFVEVSGRFHGQMDL
jgi:hypothetical protein